MIRPHLNDVLGHVVHARIEMDTLASAIIEEMREGYRPTFRGRAWGPEQFTVLEGAGYALEGCWHLLKWLQFPEMGSRLTDALEQARNLALLTEGSLRKELTR